MAKKPRANQSRQRLLVAVLENKTSLARRILENGVNPNMEDETGASLLHIAAVNGNLDMVILLIKNEADIQKLDKNGQTPLQAALTHKHNEVANYLREYESEY